ncbi:hypothetical protein [Rhizobium mesoamericanum]|nr:hypothetical protein [Rhizobium mesoamericanum]
MTLQSLLLWFWSVVRIVPARLRAEPPGDGGPTARDYEIYYWNPSPGPWY